MQYFLLARWMKRINRTARLASLYFYWQETNFMNGIGKTSIKQIAFIDFYCLMYFSGDFWDFIWFCFTFLRLEYFWLALVRSLMIVSSNTSEYISVVLTDVCPKGFWTVVIGTPFCCVQNLYNYSGDIYKYRVKWFSNIWGEWKTVSLG